ncbi:hypothetical protein FRB97_000467, partial [Tulasnella sp. 331]
MFGPSEFRISDGGSGYHVEHMTDEEMATYFGLLFPAAPTIGDAFSSPASYTACIDPSNNPFMAAEDPVLYEE